ncbi:MAG: cellulose binding domain-containing protein [bacterium]|nr:cellulose binding domain-containing protein [bacterium]
MKQSRVRKALAVALSTSMVMGNIGTMPVVYADQTADSTSSQVVGKYSFGNKEQQGYTKITKEQIYNEKDGYGFSTNEFVEEAKGWDNGVYYPRTVARTKGDSKYITDGEDYSEIKSKVWTETEESGYGVYTYENTSTFDVDLDSADYKVNVELVNPTNSDQSVSLEAEDITKKSNVKVAANETVTESYTASLVDGTLNLKFLAASNATTEEQAQESSVYVSKVTIEKEEREAGKKPTIFIASDSTVQTYDKSYYPQTGWGQVLYNFFQGGDNVKEYECEDCEYSQAQTYEDSSVIVENRAIGGRSSKSFIEEGKLDDLLEDVKPGDYVLVQWGHNDATKVRPNRYVSSDDFEKYLNYYIDGVKQRGGTCVLVTPVARRSFTEQDGVASFKSDFEVYRQVMLKIGEERNVPVLDLTQASIDVCNKFGAEGSKSLFLWLNAGDYTGNYAGGVSDSTHLQYYGAYKFAQCVAQLMKDYDKDEQLSGLQSILDLAPAFDAVPNTPSGLKTTTVGSTSVGLQWESQKDAELYYIYRAELKEGQKVEDVTFDNAEKYSVSSTTKYTDSNCEGGKTYVYAIAGFNEIGTGSISDKVSVTTKSALYKYDFCQAASNPTMKGWNQVTATQAYNKETGYGWIKAPGNGRYRSDNGKADSNDMTDDFCLGAGEFAVDLPNGDYELKVTACDLLSGTSTIKPAYSAEEKAIGVISCKQAAGTLSATVRVTDGQLNLVVGGTNAYINGLEITPISLAPTGLVYQELTFEGSKANFLMSWNDVEGAASYKVYQKGQSDSDFKEIKTITSEEKANATTLPFTAGVGDTYKYYVTAIMADGSETAASNTISITMIDEAGVKPAVPTGLKATTVENKNVVLEWNKGDDAIKYLVYRSDKAEGTKGFKAYSKIGETTSATYTDKEVNTNVNWFYKVQAVNAAGQSEMSKELKTDITSTLEKTKAETLSDRALVAINLAGDAGIGVDETGKAGTKVSSSDKGVYLSWRLFEKDPSDVSFTLYKNNEVVAKDIKVTNYLDETGSENDSYKVVGSSDQALGLNSNETAVWKNQYQEFSLDKPADQTMPDGSTCTYTSNDMSVGDVDGDGQYELIVKWYPSNAQDNSRGGYTGTTILDAYKLNQNTGDATKLWRIDLGINIRSGAHYTQFQVWDLDGDGKAEVVCKTADGTVDGKGTVIGDAKADYRNASGYVLDGPEFLTAFNGETGEIIDTVDYTPARGDVSKWGDTYGNRVDRFLSGVAYLDGEHPSAVFCRGYYTRICLTAYDLKDGKLVERWAFDTNNEGSEYESQGNHSLSVTDVDNDGKDEIIYGGLVVDDNGKVKYSTGLGHGDAMHVSDWDPNNSGLEIYAVHEHTDAQYQVEMHDAETGEILYGYFTGKDTGRGVAADIDPRYAGAEFWSSIEWNGTDGGLYSSTSRFGNPVLLSQNTPSVNFSIFWDGDLLSELQDHTFNNAGSNYYPVSTNITKWDYENNESKTLFESSEILTNNGTKGNMGLVADVMGDWREEIISRTNDSSNDKIRIYSTTIETDYSVPCLMENHAYRAAVAVENVGYNQPANLDYLLSEGVKTAGVSVKETTKNSVELAWTAASDGKYGHEITGYQVYRADTENKEYTLVGTVKASELTYTDKGLNQNKEYFYKVAAVVDGKTSFKSSSASAITSLDISSVEELGQLELVQDVADYKELFPKTVTVVDGSGKKVDGIQVTWDLSNFDISKAGTYTVAGTIHGYKPQILLTVNVLENTVVGYEALSDVYTVAGKDPVLPTTIKHNMRNGSTKTLDVVWDTSSLDINKTGEYVVTGKSQLLDTIEVKVVVRENYITSVKKPSAVEVFVGETASLPETVNATYVNDTTKDVAVLWDRVDTSKVGEVTVEGTVENYAEKVAITVNVIKKPLYRFDFGIAAGNVADGWTGITVNPKSGTSLNGYVYSKEAGYGFTDIDSDKLTSAIEGRSESYTFDGVLPEAAYQDFVLPGSKEFKVDVPNGKYQVQVVAGSYYKSNVAVSIEGADNVNINNAAGSYTIYTATGVEVKDGQLNFKFPSGTYRMDAIMITAEDNNVAATVTSNYTSDWKTGSVGTLEVKNETGKDFEDGWTLEFDCEREITELWNATLVSSENGHYVISNPSWNKELKNGGTISIGVITGSTDKSGEIKNTFFTNIEAEEEIEDHSNTEYKFASNSDWGTGCNGTVSVTNTTGADYTDGWTIEFDYSRPITEVYGATLVSSNGTHYVVSNPSWNKELKEGKNVGFSFLAGEGKKSAQIYNVILSK